jgi:hypothetical protein
MKMAPTEEQACAQLWQSIQELISKTLRKYRRLDRWQLFTELTQHLACYLDLENAPEPVAVEHPEDEGSSARQLTDAAMERLAALRRLEQADLFASREDDQ